MIEENEEMNLQSVIELTEKYKKQIFPNYRVECLYGKMKQKEKDSFMEEFKIG